MRPTIGDVQANIAYGLSRKNVDGNAKSRACDVGTWVSITFRSAKKVSNYGHLGSYGRKELNSTVSYM